MATAINENGELVELRDGQWQRVPVAEGPNGEQISLVDGKWAAQGDSEPAAAGLQHPASGILPQIAQGVSLRWADEGQAAITAALSNDGGSFKERYKNEHAKINARLDEYKRQYPKTATGVEMGSGAALGMAQAAKIPLLQAGNWAKAALLGGGEGAILGSGGNDTDRLGGALEGGTIGAVAGPAMYGAGELAGRLGRVIPGIRAKKYRPEGEMEKRNIDVAKELDFKLTPADLTDSRSLKMAENNMKRNMGGAAPFDSQYKHNQNRVQTIVNKELGLSGTEVDLGKAKQINSQAFEDVAKTGVKIKFDMPFLKSVEAAQKAYKASPGRGSKKKIFKDFADEVEESGGAITARRYMDMMSSLSEDLYKASNRGDGGQVRLYGSLQKALDEAADRSIPESNTAFHAARRAFRTRKTLERPGVVNPGTGAVSIAKLANAQNSNKDFIYGWDQTDLGQIMRTHHAFKDTIGASGTPEGSVASLLAAPIYYPISRGYNAIPKSMFGSTGTGEKAARGLLAPLVLTEEYRKNPGLLGL